MTRKSLQAELSQLKFVEIGTAFMARRASGDVVILLRDLERLPNPLFAKKRKPAAKKRKR
jgi:hypothetical protein